MCVQDKRIWQRTFCDPLPHSFHPETILRVSRDGVFSATPKGFVSCSGIFAARTPARRALRLRECYGLPTVNRYHGTLTPPRIAPSRPFKEETEVSSYPTSPSSQAAAPHGCLVSLLIARSGWRSWRQKTSRFEKRGKIRSTDYSVFKEP